MRRTLVQTAFVAFKAFVQCKHASICSLIKAKPEVIGMFINQISLLSKDMTNDEHIQNDRHTGKHDIHDGQ